MKHMTTFSWYILSLQASVQGVFVGYAAFCGLFVEDGSGVSPTYPIGTTASLPLLMTQMLQEHWTCR